jgi:hypothetical protein
METWSDGFGIHKKIDSHNIYIDRVICDISDTNEENHTSTIPIFLAVTKKSNLK